MNKCPAGQNGKVGSLKRSSCSEFESRVGHQNTCSYSIMALHYIGNVETLDRNQVRAPSRCSLRDRQLSSKQSYVGSNPTSGARFVIVKDVSERQPSQHTSQLSGKMPTH